MDLEKHIALIRDTLVRGLNHVRPAPEIVIEEADYGGKLYVFVASRHFAGMNQTTRDKIVREVIDHDLPPETWVKIARLFVLTPREAKFWLEPEEKAAETEESSPARKETLTTVPT
jgi:hypothetical protein